MAPPIKFLYVYCFPVSPSRADFATLFPLRLKSQFDKTLDVQVLYSGNLNDDKLTLNGIKCHRFTTIRFLHWPLLVLSLRRLVRREKIQIVSNVWAHYLVFLGRRRPAVISRGVDVESFPFRGNNYPQKPRRLLYVGRMERPKGLDDLLTAFARLSQAYPQLSLTLVGPGAPPEIPPAIKKKVRFLGMLDHGQLPKVYSQADVLLLPSWSEGLPAAVLEAMASGVLVIASEVGDIPLLLGDGRGFLVPPRDIDGLCLAVQKALGTDPGTLRCMLRDARAYVEEYHSLAATRRQYLEFWGKELGVAV
jgi:glycosyltransferase involved in cell wall biosynthesis